MKIQLLMLLSLIHGAILTPVAEKTSAEDAADGVESLAIPGAEAERSKRQTPNVNINDVLPGEPSQQTQPQREQNPPDLTPSGLEETEPNLSTSFPPTSNILEMESDVTGVNVSELPSTILLSLHQDTQGTTGALTNPSSSSIPDTFPKTVVLDYNPNTLTISPVTSLTNQTYSMPYFPTTMASSSPLTSTFIPPSMGPLSLTPLIILLSLTSKSSSDRDEVPFHSELPPIFTDSSESKTQPTTTFVSQTQSTESPPTSNHTVVPISLELTPNFTNSSILNLLSTSTLTPQIQSTVHFPSSLPADNAISSFESISTRSPSFLKSSSSLPLSFNDSFVTTFQTSSPLSDDLQSTNSSISTSISFISSPSTLASSPFIIQTLFPETSPLSLSPTQYTNQPSVDSLTPSSTLFSELPPPNELPIVIPSSTIIPTTPLSISPVVTHTSHDTSTTPFRSMAPRTAFLTTIPANDDVFSIASAPNTLNTKIPAKENETPKSTTESPTDNLIPAETTTNEPPIATTTTAGTTSTTTTAAPTTTTTTAAPTTTTTTTVETTTTTAAAVTATSTVETTAITNAPTTAAAATTTRVPSSPRPPSEIKPLYPYSPNADSPPHLEEANCNFGSDSNPRLCQWKNMKLSEERWMESIGESSFWLGGPIRDHTSGNIEGGYGLYETSKLTDNPSAPQTVAFDSAMLMSPLLRKTDAVGTCIDFWYASEGLSPDKLRILLRPPSPFIFGSGSTQELNNTEFTDRLLRSDGRDDIVLWEHRDTTKGEWINGQVVYSFNDRHLVIFEGLPLTISDPNRAYQGYLAIDDLSFISGSECKPFCNFEAGMCSWSDDTNDDFDWSQSRGSINPSTGPPMDRFSFNYGIKGGGYAYIDSGYPRRPKDKARLLSEVFNPPDPDKPLCMRFWTHMFGNGIGSLRIIIAPTNGEEEVIWELKGEQGNNWYQGQVTITANSDFQIVIEAEVGDNSLGDIAIDEIALKEDACPTSPQSASKFKGDCTFEVDECGWRNVEFRQRMDELDWERTIASQSRAPNKDHTLQSTLGSYMTLPRNSVQRGERGWLMSTTIDPPQGPLCISFWYFMYDPFIEATGPSLGALRLMLMEMDNQGGFPTLTPLWMLRNHQGPNWQYAQASFDTPNTFVMVFEGLWGNSRGSEYIALDDITFFLGECSNVPEKSIVSFLDCDFTRDSCSYLNTSSIRNERWLTASISRRPSTLADHTYGGPTGYIYFDVFNTDNTPPQVSIMSRVIESSEDREPMCLSFWFAPIGNDAGTKLIVSRETVDPNSNAADGRPGGNGLKIWEITANNVFKDRIEWMFGQVQVSTENDFKITFIGEARKGGFALDDIQVYPGICKMRPSQLGANELGKKK